MIFENENVYKVLKKILVYVFPAIIYVFSQLVDIWNIPYGLQINATIFALYVGLAIFLGVSKNKYQNALNGYLSDGYEEGSEEDEQFPVG